MKALLICPAAKPAVHHLHAFGPLATVPILGDCLVGYWIEHLAALGARQIEIVAPDGPDDVSEAVGDGARWGVSLKVTSCNVEPTRQEAAARHHPGHEPGWLPEPYDIVVMSHLPGCPGLPLFESYAGWFAALTAWMSLATTPSRVRVTEARPGIRVGSRARVSKEAILIAPCWIGDQASVEAGAVVGPNAILEDRAVADGMARITQSWVGPDTCVGPMTCVSNSLAWGSTLTDWRTDSSLHVPDPFLLSSLVEPRSQAGTDRFGRALASKPAAGLKLGGLKLGFVNAMRAPDVNLPG